MSNLPSDSNPSRTPSRNGAAATPALARAVDQKLRSDHKEPRRSLNEVFRTFSNGTARAVGTPWAFFGAVLLIVLWGCSYKLFVHAPPGTPEHRAGFDTWQLVINTATTIVTF